ncbi:MAG: prepilin peptidase [Agathobacter sp.]|uniref:prepilin peptidase n=1 Tax=Agathobacter sp. TaxID=2021311 RepID=UPI002583BAD7|nr:prepilin peptidase [Agathobacter sp.]MCR5677319.1 prepilin peptidase [Agathobacter sp.]
MGEEWWLIPAIGPVMLLNSITDLKKREISLKISVLWGLVGIAIRIGREYYGNGFHLIDWVGMLVGLFVIAVAILSNGQIGIGDGIIMVALSFYLELEALLTAILVAGIGVALCALILFLIFHKGRRYQIPFVPFLTLGVLVSFGGIA